jgi:DNA polymerase I-like protein with 3'-5' exonuclease and polymerase domains
MLPARKIAIRKTKKKATAHKSNRVIIVSGPKKTATIKRRTKPDKVEYFSSPSYGDLTAPILMVIDPVFGKLNAKDPLSKEQAQWMFQRLSKYGKFKREDVCIVSAAPPVSGEVWGQGRLLNAHMKEHRDELLNLIDKNKPKFIIPFGAKACQQVIGRAVQITKVRGQAFEEPGICGGIPVLPMLSPFYAQRQPDTEATFNADLQTAARIVKAKYNVSDSVIKYKKDYKWCYDLAPLLKSRPSIISVDVETVGLIPFNPDTKILTVQISTEPGKSIMVPINYDYGKLRHHNFIPWETIDRKKLLKQVKTLLEDPRISKVGHNFKFDVQMLYHQMGIDVQGYDEDTMLLAHLNDENIKLNIDDLVRLHVPEMAGFNDVYNNDPDHHGKSRMDLLPPDKMLPYGCGDTDAALRLLNVLREVVGGDKKLLNCYNRVTMPAQRAFCDIERNGFPVDEDALRSFQKDLRLHQKLERAYIMRRIPKSIKDKWRDSGVGLKVTRGDLLRDWLYLHPDGLNLEPVVYTKTGLPSTSSKQAMPFYVADHPIIARVSEYIKNDKMLNTYAKGFWKYIYDGKIRPTYKLASTVTGRSASADPNGQNFPKRGKMAKKYRRIFKAPKGWVFISLDLSQAELRIAAMMSGDRNMINVYKSGGDIHRMTAAGTMGLTLKAFLELDKDVQALKRYQAKAVNFGFLYGMWWKKFRTYAKTDYGIDFTEEEAQQIRERFFETYPMLLQWHDAVQQIVAANGYIRTFDGRIRHLPNVRSRDEGMAKQAMRQGINSPVQSIASDLGLMTLGRLVPYLKETGKDEWLKPCGFIHDAIVCLVREDKVAAGCKIVKYYMENNPLEEWFDWEPEVPIIADAEIGRTLSDTYEIDASLFEGSAANENKSYTDLLKDVYAEHRGMYTKATTDKDKAKIAASMDAIEADAKLSGAIDFSFKEKRRKITIRKRVTNNGNQTQAPGKAKGRRIRLRKSLRKSA